jgi:glycosyltransferase involved in cell wall biosynthesis
LSFDVPLFFRLLFGPRADLYLVEPPPTTGAVVRVATTLLRRPYVYDAADLWSDAAQMVTSSRVVIKILRAIEVFAIRGAAHAFAISDHLIARMRELKIDTPATEVGFGVDTTTFFYTTGSTPTDGPYFIYAGTYSEWHGAGIFIDAFAGFTRDHPGYRLVFVGNGSERDKLEGRSAELGLDNVEFRDPIDGPLLNTLFADATASLASVKPGVGYDYAFATKVYASIAAGCPVIFTGAGPTNAFVQNARSVVRIGSVVPYEVDAVARAMEAAAKSPARPGDRQALSVWTRDRFSLKAIAGVVVDASVALAAQRSRS